MRSLSASELLNVWEWGRTQPPWSRALRLLATACPETPIDVLGKLSIGQRDALLLTLREWSFGSKLVSLAVCPSCGERLELNFNVADIRVAPLSEPVEMISLSVADYEISFRLPNSLDLMAIASHKHLATAADILVERCLVKVAHNDADVLVNQLPPHIIDVVAEQMAQADPQAEVQLAVSCPACCHQWQPLFDIGSFFWIEINAWAFRVLREVHTLATAYGWREADILAMSPNRRQLYLEMVVSK